MNEIMNDDAVLFLSDRWGNITVKGGGDNFNTGFFKSVRLRMQDANVSEPFRQHVWTYSCIQTISTALKAVPFNIIKDKNGDKKNVRAFIREMRSERMGHMHRYDGDCVERRGFEIIESGDIYDLFKNVNPIMTRSQLWESWAINMFLSGSVFWILQGQNGPVAENELPVEIWPYGADRWEAKLNNGMLSHWIFKQGGGEKEKKFERYQVLRFYKYNPYRGLHGLAPYDAVKTAAAQDYKAMKYNEAFFDNGAEPGGILMHESYLSPEKSTAILNKWNDRHQGPGKRAKTGLLIGGAKYDRNPVRHVDMQFLDGRKWNRDETFAAYRVPKIMGSIYEDIQLATAIMAKRSFWEDTIIPEIRYIEDVINTRLFENSKIKEVAGHYCMFDLSGVEALRDDLGKKAEIMERLTKTGVPLNDMIEMLDLPIEPKPWGDKWWAPINVVPVDGSGDNDATGTNDDDDDESKSANRTKESFFSSTVVRLDRVLLKYKFSQLWNMYIERIFKPVEEPFRSKMRAFFMELRKHQLEKWSENTRIVSKSKIPSPGELNAILFDRTVWGDKISERAIPFLQNAGQFSLEQIADELGTPIWDITDPRIVEILNTKKNYIRGITNRFWHVLRESIINGINEKYTVNELSKVIKTQFNQAASHARTLRIARTETAQAASAVRDAALKYEGVKKAEWGTAKDEAVRDDHVAFGEAGIKTIGYNFMNVIGKPGTLEYPSQMGGPADQVINCRCIQLPVI